ncbi:hypothetical protein ACWIG5_38505, partial [Streptomyces lydicus]
RAGRPFQDSDVDLICDVVGTDMFAVLEDNARACYRLPAKARPVPEDPAPTLPLHRAEQPTLPIRRDTLPTPDTTDTLPLPIIE